MGRYGSWISVSDFYVEVCADNEEEAKQKIMDTLGTISVQVIEEDENVYTDLDCKITDIDRIGA